MKIRKIAACLLTLSMLASLTGCSKVKRVTSDDFVGSCEELGAEEFEPNELEEMDLSDALDGVYVVFDRDYLEDEIPDEVKSVLVMSGLDLDIDFDDLEQVEMYLRLSVNDATDPDDIPEFEDAKIDAVAACHIALSEVYEVEDIMDGIEDLLGKVEIDTDDFQKSEYWFNDKGGYLRLRVNLTDFVEALTDSDIYDYIEDDDSVSEIIDDLEGDICLEILVTGDNILVVASVDVRHEPDGLNGLCDQLRIDNPYELESSEVVISGIIRTLERYSDLTSGLRRYIERAGEAADELVYYGF